MIISESNFLLLAANFYDIKKSSSDEEFYDDIKRFQYVKKAFKKYRDSGDINSRLVLNHIIILYNCFGNKTTEFLFYKLEGYHTFLLPFLIFLNRLVDKIDYNERRIYLSDISPDNNIIDDLRKGN